MNAAVGHADDAEGAADGAVDAEDVEDAEDAVGVGHDEHAADAAHGGRGDAEVDRKRGDLEAVPNGDEDVALSTAQRVWQMDASRDPLSDAFGDVVASYLAEQGVVVNGAAPKEPLVDVASAEPDNLLFAEGAEPPQKSIPIPISMPMSLPMLRRWTDDAVVRRTVHLDETPFSFFWRLARGNCHCLPTAASECPTAPPSTAGHSLQRDPVSTADWPAS